MSSTALLSTPSERIQPVISIVVFDQQTIFLRGLERLFNADHEFIHVLAVSTDGVMASTLVSKERPDLVLIDLVMPSPGALTAIESLTDSNPTVPIVVFSASEDLDEIVQALKAGAVAFLPKAHEPEELIAPLQLVRQGWAIVPHVVNRYSMRLLSQVMPIAAAQNLTVSQLDVWCMIGHGWTDAAISEQLTCSLRTTKRIVQDTCRIVGAKNRSYAAALAGQAGLLLVDPMGSTMLPS